MFQKFQVKIQIFVHMYLGCPHYVCMRKSEKSPGKKNWDNELSLNSVPIEKNSRYHNGVWTCFSTIAKFLTSSILDVNCEKIHISNQHFFPLTFRISQTTVD